MNKVLKKALSVLVALLIVWGQLPWISMTAHAEPTEELLTTITGTGGNSDSATSETISYSTEGVATLTFSGEVHYRSNPAWGWWGDDITLTVTPADGYTITKCVFYDNIDNNATDSEAPFVVETSGEQEMPKVNGSYIYQDINSIGVKKIEVYGYANPTTVDVTGVSLNKTTTTLTVGDTETLTETVNPNDATDKSVIWSSDNTNVATVDTNGLVTAVGVGTANITVTSNSDSTKNASCSVTVNPATYNVLLTGGSNAIISGGSTSQSELSGAMETVTYTANSGYHFADFTDITQNGITVTKTSDSVVTVSGIPTADVNIVVPDAIAKTQISYTITFNVANGSWNNGGSDVQTVTLTGYEGDTLTLAADQIPAVGSNPDATYKAGSWDTTPTADMEITADTTFTYTYAKESTAPITYTNTEGAGSSYTLGTNGSLTFRFTRSENDAETINHFTGIKVDNVEVSSSNYTYSAGSVIVNLKPEYLQTLSVGQHTLTAMFNDGDSVTVNFTIVAAAENTPTPTTTPTPTPAPTGTAVPSTGETFPVTAIFGIVMIIAACIAVMTARRPKKYKVRKVKL